MGGQGFCNRPARTRYSLTSHRGVPRKNQRSVRCFPTTPVPNTAEGSLTLNSNTHTLLSEMELRRVENLYGRGGQVGPKEMGL